MNKKYGFMALPEQFGWYFNWSAVKSGLQNTSSTGTDGSLCPSDWRMPSKEECDEIKNQTYSTNTWVTSPVKGMQVISKTDGNTLFFPAAGYGGGREAGVFGYYWSSTREGTENWYAYNLLFAAYITSGSVTTSETSWGQSVRCVR